MLSPESQPLETPPIPPLLDCWFLTGPTASGKTRVSLELARRLNAEIVSLDSMALYREMDIGTAKPTLDERRLARHHLIDVLAPNEEFSAADYVEAAQAAVGEIRARGREALFVGGAPLYLKALLRGIFPGPPADWRFRRRLEVEVRAAGVEALHERLKRVDPASAAKLHPHDLRRIIRALEVYQLTGRPISVLQTQFDRGRPAEQGKVFVLDWPRPLLHRRIEARVDAMFAAGLVEEVRGLLDRYGRLSRTAGQAVGYRETIEHLQGARGLGETVERVKSRTRRFARRQETWFRSLTECRRVPQQPGADPAETASKIVALAAENA